MHSVAVLLAHRLKNITNEMLLVITVRIISRYRLTREGISSIEVDVLAFGAPL